MDRANQPQLQLFVDRLLCHSILTFEEQQAILNFPCRIEQLDNNRELVRLGDEVSQCCLVVAGLIGRFDQNRDGCRQITAIHIAGDMPDLFSVVWQRGSSGLQTLSRAAILHVPHAAIRAVAVQYPALAEAFWRDCMLDVGILARWMVNLGCQDAKARVSHLLCEMAVRLKALKVDGAFSFPFPVTQTQLAEATGLTVVHVNRILRRLREDNLAELRSHVVHVFDWDGLVKAADFDAAYLQSAAREARRRYLQV